VGTGAIARPAEQSKAELNVGFDFEYLNTQKPDAGKRKPQRWLMTSKQKFGGMTIALGAALGAVLGAITGQMGVWLAVGIAIGVAIGVSMRPPQKPECPHCAAMHRSHEAIVERRPS
jgi:hypothetical protein